MSRQNIVLQNTITEYTTRIEMVMEKYRELDDTSRRLWAENATLRSQVQHLNNHTLQMERLRATLEHESRVKDEQIIQLSAQLNNQNNTSESIASKRLKVLHKYLNIDKRKSEGIYVTEFDRSFDRIHHHMLLYSELSLSDVTYRVNKYWGKIGRVDVREYDDTKAPCKYVVKHINKSDKNTYDFFM